MKTLFFSILSFAIITSQASAEIKLLTGCKDFPEVPKIAQAEADYAEAESKLSLERRASSSYEETCKQYQLSAGQGDGLLAKITSEGSAAANAKIAAKNAILKAKTVLAPTFKNIHALGAPECASSIKAAYQRLEIELKRINIPLSCMK